MQARRKQHQVRTKSNMAKRYTTEFKRDAVAFVRSSPHRNVTEIAQELEVTAEGLRGWVKQDRTDRGESDRGELTSAEREELTRLRRQTVEQQKTIEIPRTAAAYSAAETTQ